VDAGRPTAAQRGYGARWQRARARYLRENPFCVECRMEGRIEVATVVDHIVPHRGDPTLFWDEANWRALCRGHHDIATARYDGGFGNPRKPKPVVDDARKDTDLRRMR